MHSVRQKISGEDPLLFCPDPDPTYLLEKQHIFLKNSEIHSKLSRSKILRTFFEFSKVGIKLRSSEKNFRSSSLQKIFKQNTNDNAGPEDPVDFFMNPDPINWKKRIRICRDPQLFVSRINRKRFNTPGHLKYYYSFQILRIQDQQITTLDLVERNKTNPNPTSQTTVFYELKKSAILISEMKLKILKAKSYIACVFVQHKSSIKLKPLLNLTIKRNKNIFFGSEYCVLQPVRLEILRACVWP